MKKLCSLMLHTAKVFNTYDHHTYSLYCVRTDQCMRNFEHYAKARPIYFTQYTNIYKVEIFHDSGPRR